MVMRALFSGVSGLRNHQVRMDVIANNIANVNTIGFKSGRVTFEEAFAQLLSGGSRPPGDQGGVNPVQVGLGMNIASVDQNFSQGTLESTGQNTDLAIQGLGFFVVSDGNRQFYTRSGNFQLDADGRLVVPTNGFIVQGRLADSNGDLTSTAIIEDIVLPFGEKAPARATTEVTFLGNLDARENPLGTVLVTDERVFAIEQSTSNGGAGTNVNGLYARGLANGQVLGMAPGSTTVTVDDGTTSRTYTYVENDAGPGDAAFNSLNDLIAEINADFVGQVSAAMNDVTGAIVFTAGAAINLSLSATNPVFTQALSAANATLAAGGTSTTDQFSHVATNGDLLVNLRDDTGVSLGLAAGQNISIDGSVGGTPIASGSFAVAAGSTYQELAAQIETSFAFSNQDGASIDAGTGALRLTGDGGLVNEVSGVNVRVAGGVAPGFDTIFDATPGNYREVQAATDVVFGASITVFDSLGEEHVVTMEFIKDATTLNRWLWRASVPQPAIISRGSTGSVTFDADGSLLTFTYDGGANSFQFDPGTGAAAPVDMEFDTGVVGDINGLSQFAAPATVVASSQDGFPMGNLQDIAIDEQGIITGFFSNGVNQPLAQIVLAAFNNPSGLLRVGDNAYDVSGNSGQAVLGFAGTSNQSIITPGALESSNVDLSEEFTRMIIAQRGFQANARVITTADEMLTELVNLIR